MVYDFWYLGKAIMALSEFLAGVFGMVIFWPPFSVSVLQS